MRGQSDRRGRGYGRGRGREPPVGPARGRGSSRREEGEEGGGQRRGRGGRQPDDMVGRQEAFEVMQGYLRDVYSARPEDFLEQQQQEQIGSSSEAGYSKAVRPNKINEISEIWEPAKVEMNLFQISSKVPVAYQYDLQVNKQILGQPLESSQVYKKVFSKLQEEQNWPPSVLHDGRKTVWDISDQLPKLEDYELEIDAGRDIVFVTFKLVRQLDNMQELQQDALMDRFQVGNFDWLVPHECIRVLEVALHHNVLYQPNKFLLRNRTVFDVEQSEEEMQGNRAYELLCGYKESVRVVTEGLVVNINTVYNMSRKGGNVLKFYQNNGVPDPHHTVEDHGVLDDLNLALRDLRVTYRVEDQSGQFIMRTYKIKYVDDRGADSYQLELENGEQITVQEYYWRIYGYKIRFPALNLLDCSKPGGDQPIMIPPELCRVQRGEFERAQGRLQAELIRKAAKAPSLRHQDINRACGSVANRISEAPAKFWIGQLQTNWLHGRGFMVPPPIIQYEGNCFVRPQAGVWQGWQYGDNQQQQFHRYQNAQSIESMGILNFSPRSSYLYGQFLEDMVEFGNQHTMKFIKPIPAVIVHCGRPQGADKDSVMQRIQEAVDNALELYEKFPQIIFVLLPEEDTAIYKLVKSVLEGNHFSTQDCPKIASQCVVLSKYDKGRNNFGYLKQLMLKVNLKLGGGNFRIAGGYQSMPIGPTMQSQLPQDNHFSEFHPFIFLGADVTHPAANETEKSSIAAVTATMDSSCTRYCARITSQKGRQEYIEAMEECVHSLLEQFLKTESNNMLPQTIIMFRDGVSEGQYDQVLAHEYSGIRRAANRFGEDYYPKITFIVVTKRHHIRPRPAEEKVDDGKRNLVPGIVIDESGCHPYEFQFYLNSHATIQGTNRPAMYTVLVDEVGFGAEQLQLLTNWLTYTYQRCTRSVSIPPPAYLADLACTRGRILEGEHCHHGMVDDSMLSQMYWV